MEIISTKKISEKEDIKIRMKVSPLVEVEKDLRALMLMIVQLHLMNKET